MAVAGGHADMLIDRGGCRMEQQSKEAKEDFCGCQFLAGRRTGDGMTSDNSTWEFLD